MNRADMRTAMIAARIVACVNACEGMADAEELLRATQNIAAFKKQRDSWEAAYDRKTTTSASQLEAKLEALQVEKDKLDARFLWVLTHADTVINKWASYPTIPEFYASVDEEIEFELKLKDVVDDIEETKRMKHG